MFFYVRKESRKAVEVALGVRIEFMVVTLATTHRRAHPDGRRRADAVGGVFGQVLLVLRAALVGRLQLAVVAGGYVLPIRRIWQQITRQLLRCELVK